MNRIWEITGVKFKTSAKLLIIDTRWVAWLHASTYASRMKATFYSQTQMQMQEIIGLDPFYSSSSAPCMVIHHFPYSYLVHMWVCQSNDCSHFPSSLETWKTMRENSCDKHVNYLWNFQTLSCVFKPIVSWLSPCWDKLFMCGRIMASWRRKYQTNSWWMLLALGCVEARNLPWKRNLDTLQNGGCGGGGGCESIGQSVEVCSRCLHLWGDSWQPRCNLGGRQIGFTTCWVLKFLGMSSWLVLSYWIVVGRLDHAFQVSRKKKQQSGENFPRKFHKASTF